MTLLRGQGLVGVNSDFKVLGQIHDVMSILGAQVVTSSKRQLPSNLELRRNITMKIGLSPLKWTKAFLAVAYHWLALLETNFGEGAIFKRWHYFSFHSPSGTILLPAVEEFLIFVRQNGSRMELFWTFYWRPTLGREQFSKRGTILSPIHHVAPFNTTCGTISNVLWTKMAPLTSASLQRVKKIQCT